MTHRSCSHCVNNSHSEAYSTGSDFINITTTAYRSGVYGFGKRFGIGRPMTVWRKLVVAAALSATPVLSGAAHPQQSAPTQPPAEQSGARFRSAVDLVSVAAVVRDRKGRFVADLSQRDFTVVEGGQPRPIVGFRSEADGPVRLAIVFDVSGSMRVGTKAADAREAARLLLSSLSPG